MNSPGSVWSRLETRRKIAVVGATLAVFAAVLLLTRGAPARDMALLYSGLDAAAAGDVVTALEGRGTLYEVRGSAIYVDAADRDLLRMSLASEGLPANGAQGYELLDSLSGFGTTSQMFDAAYWRAKEGELARTIVASPHVRAARVHISTPSARPFQRDQKATAAVTVTSASGSLSTDQAEALRYLVAAAVPGLSPADVAVIDGEGGLIAAADSGTGSPRGAEREAALRDSVERLLEAHVGYGNAVVELSVETATETEQITERRIEPDSRVAISTEVQERSDQSTDSRGGGAVTVASNLPDGAAAEGNDGQSSSQSAETREITNYEISESQREVVRGPGAIKRITVAVLVNERSSVDPATGEATADPRSEEELAALKEVVASAVGLDEGRGDVLTLRAMPFEPVTLPGTEALEAEVPGTPLDLMALIQLGTLAAVALGLGLFVVRPILTSARPAALPAPEGAGFDALPGPAPLGLPGAGPAEAGDGLALGELPTFNMIDFDSDGDGGGGPTTSAEDLAALDPLDRLRRLMDERQDEAMAILQNWVEDGDRRESA